VWNYLNSRVLVFRRSSCPRDRRLVGALSGRVMASKQTGAALTVTGIIQQRKKSNIVDDATSRQKAIAASTKGPE
jgi:hypothetical protein